MMKFYIRLAREKFSGSDNPISVEVDAPSLTVAETRLGAVLTRLVAEGGPKQAPAVPIIDGATISSVERNLPHDKYGMAVGRANITATLVTSDGPVQLTGEDPVLDYRALADACSDRRTVSLVVDGTERPKKLDHSGCQRELQRVKEARNTDLRKERDRLKEALEQVISERDRRLPAEAMTGLQATADARAREIVKLEAEKAEIAEAWKKDRLELIRIQDHNASLTEQIRLARADRDAVVAHAAKIGTERDHYRNQAVGFGEDLARTRTELEGVKASATITEAALAMLQADMKPLQDENREQRKELQRLATGDLLPVLRAHPEYKAMLRNLTDAQERCNEMLEELREMKRVPMSAVNA